MNDKLYLLVVGGRSFNDYDLLKKVLLSEIADHKSVEIVSGGANGADALAKRFANEYKLDYKEFPANWQEYGKAAGYKRNYSMHLYISQQKLRKCIAFWNGISKGTTHSFALSNQFGTELKIIKY